MSKPVGVTISAVLAVLGSFILLLIGLTCFVAPVEPSDELTQVEAYYLGFIFVALSLWGLLTGVGLFMWKHWARVSLLIFSGLVTFGFATAVFFIACDVLYRGLPIFAGEDEEILFVVFSSFVGMVIWWLFQFTRASVKSQFSVPTKTSRSPASIKVISVCFFFFGLISILLAFYFRTAFVGSIFLAGWPAVMVFIVQGILSIYIGVGLLRLDEFSRKFAIGYVIFSGVSIWMIFLDPNLESHLTQIDTELGGVLPQLPKDPEAMDQITSAIADSLYVTLLYGAASWFLVKRKNAFVAPEESALPPFPEPPSVD